VIARGSAQVLHSNSPLITFPLLTDDVVDAIFILFPVCRNFISLLRRTPLNSVIPFDRNVDFHSKLFSSLSPMSWSQTRRITDDVEQVAWAIVFFSIVHTIAQIRNFIRPPHPFSDHADNKILLAIAKKRYPNRANPGRRLISSGVVGFIKYNFATGPGITGWLMWASLGIMVWFAREKSKRANVER
jgi:hypothetical protein